MNSALVERVAAAMRPKLFQMFPNGQSSMHNETRRMARAAIEAIGSEIGWQPIETAPHEEFIHTVLIARDHGNRCVMPAFFDGENWRTFGIIGGPMVFTEPTHWRQLPEPPALSPSASDRTSTQDTDNGEG